MNETDKWLEEIKLLRFLRFLHPVMLSTDGAFCLTCGGDAKDHTHATKAAA